MWVLFNNITFQVATILIKTSWTNLVKKCFYSIAIYVRVFVLMYRNVALKCDLLFIPTQISHKIFQAEPTYHESKLFTMRANYLP